MERSDPADSPVFGLYSLFGRYLYGACFSHSLHCKRPSLTRIIHLLVVLTLIFKTSATSRTLAPGLIASHPACLASTNTPECKVCSGVHSAFLAHQFTKCTHEPPLSHLSANPTNLPAKVQLSQALYNRMGVRGPVLGGGSIELLQRSSRKEMSLQEREAQT